MLNAGWMRWDNKTFMIFICLNSPLGKINFYTKLYLFRWGEFCINEYHEWRLLIRREGLSQILRILLYYLPAVGVKFKAQ